MARRGRRAIRGMALRARPAAVPSARDAYRYAANAGEVGLCAITRSRSTGEPTIADTERPNDSRPAGRSPPGRHRSQSMAGVDRDLEADIISQWPADLPESALLRARRWRAPRTPVKAQGREERSTNSCMASQRR